MEHAKELTEKDPESSKKIKSIINTLESDFSRNERAALAFTIIDIFEKIEKNRWKNQSTS